MKIVHIINSCSYGGAEIFVKSLLLKSIQIYPMYEYEIWVMSNIKHIYPNDKSKHEIQLEFENELLTKGICIKYINKIPKRQWREAKSKIEKLYIEFKPDIIHTHAENITFHVCRALSKYNTPIIETIHSSLIRYKFIHKLYIKKKIKCYVAICELVKKKIKIDADIENERIYTIYNGIELDKFMLQNREINLNVTRILAIGRLTKAKDYPNLIEAFYLLKKKLEHEKVDMPKLYIVGYGELEKELRKLVEKYKLQGDCIFLGLRNDIPKLLAESDIYVMSSEWEGLSISLIEALSSKIPIVATDAGSNNEIIDDNLNGIIVPTKDPNKLMEALYKLIIDYELRKKFVNSSSEKACKFDILKSTKKHIKLYNNIINNLFTEDV